MIVDDEPHVVHVVKQFLERKGYSVVTAPNGLRALEVYEETHPVMIITDVQMPLMGGQELCETILKKKDLHSLKIFVMTSRTDKALRVWSEGFPMIEFLEKPISLRRLSARMDAIESEDR